MSNYIPQKLWDIITDPCSNLISKLVKEAPDKLQVWLDFLWKTQHGPVSIINLFIIIRVSANCIWQHSPHSRRGCSNIKMLESPYLERYFLYWNIAMYIKNGAYFCTTLWHYSSRCFNTGLFCHKNSNLRNDFWNRIHVGVIQGLHRLESSPSFTTIFFLLAAELALVLPNKSNECKKTGQVSTSQPKDFFKKFSFSYPTDAIIINSTILWFWENYVKLCEALNWPVLSWWEQAMTNDQDSPMDIL